MHGHMKNIFYQTWRVVKTKHTPWFSSLHNYLQRQWLGVIAVCVTFSVSYILVEDLGPLFFTKLLQLIEGCWHLFMYSSLTPDRLDFEWVTETTWFLSFSVIPLMCFFPTLDHCSVAWTTKLYVASYLTLEYFDIKKISWWTQWQWLQNPEKPKSSHHHHRADSCYEVFVMRFCLLYYSIYIIHYGQTLPLWSQLSNI